MVKIWLFNCIDDGDVHHDDGNNNVDDDNDDYDDNDVDATVNDEADNADDNADDDDGDDFDTTANDDDDDDFTVNRENVYSPSHTSVYEEKEPAVYEEEEPVHPGVLPAVVVTVQEVRRIDKPGNFIAAGYLFNFYLNIYFTSRLLLFNPFCTRVQVCVCVCVELLKRTNNETTMVIAYIDDY